MALRKVYLHNKTGVSRWPTSAPQWTWDQADVFLFHSACLLWFLILTALVFPLEHMKFGKASLVSVIISGISDQCSWADRTPVQKVAVLFVIRLQPPLEEEEKGGSGYVYWTLQTGMLLSLELWIICLNIYLFVLVVAFIFWESEGNVELATDK